MQSVNKIDGAAGFSKIRLYLIWSFQSSEI